jgi:hypothetical protein
MEYCEVCEKPLKRVNFREEAWGRMETTVLWECVNIDCGTEEEVEHDEE